MANLNELLGKKVVVTNDQQGGIFTEGNIYTVTGIGNCGYGKGVTTEEQGRSFVLADGNYELVTEVLKKPAQLDLRGLLQALYDEEEVVSIDTDDDSVTDIYDDLKGLADDICSFEITDNVFYLKADWDAYIKAVEEAKTPAPVDLTFEEAIELLVEGTAVTSFDDDGDEVDTYSNVRELTNLAGFEVDGVWRKAE